MCEDCGLCAWYPFAKKYDEKTNDIVLFAPESYPGTIIGCSVTDMEKGENGCGIPYAATYGAAGPYWEGPGWEDWAESFASYVYTDYFPSRKPSRIALIAGGIREIYIEEQIDAIP